MWFMLKWMFCMGNITWSLLAWDTGFLDSFSLTLIVFCLSVLFSRNWKISKAHGSICILKNWLWKWYSYQFLLTFTFLRILQISVSDFKTPTFLLSAVYYESDLSFVYSFMCVDQCQLCFKRLHCFVHNGVKCGVAASQICLKSCL